MHFTRSLCCSFLRVHVFSSASPLACDRRSRIARVLPLQSQLQCQQLFVGVACCWIGGASAHVCVSGSSCCLAGLISHLLSCVCLMPQQQRPQLAQAISKPHHTRQCASCRWRRFCNPERQCRTGSLCHPAQALQVPTQHRESIFV